MEMRRLILVGLICLPLYLCQRNTEENEWEKRSNADVYPDYYLGLKFDEYPTIVPRKRTALLLDRFMTALKKAIEEEERANASAGSDKIRSKSVKSEDTLRTMDLQRRGQQGSMAGQQKGRLYWRCYFNAVTCFK